MTDFPKLQAHRGVSTEYPENTMPAFEAAVRQGYDVIELDPAYTADGQIVVLHDKTLNRTARNADGSPLTGPVEITNITLSEARSYDFGIGFSPRYKGERIPLLEDVLTLARECGIRVKLDNKIERFPAGMTEALYVLIRRYEAHVGITTARAAMIRFYAEQFPTAELHYDGPVDEAVLSDLAPYGDRLTVWMPYQSPLTSWVKVPFAHAALCRAVKRIAKLGIWILKDTDDFDAVCTAFAPDIVETTGTVKPILPAGMLCDMHVHSQNSHDSTCPVAKTAEAALEKGISLFTVTDHADIDKYVSRDTVRSIAASVREAEEAAKAYDGKVRILHGIELSEGFWHPHLAAELLGQHDFDVIIGSVHSVRYKNLSDSYSCIDFSVLPEEVLIDFMHQYFDDVLEMLKTMPCDIMAHLTCPLRYINGKYGRNLDSRLFEEQIVEILAYIRDHGIAMEVNTSGIGTAFASLMPDEWIIRRFHEMGGYLITLGSDAHTAERIGHAFPDVLRLLKECGYQNYYCCERRMHIQCPL